MNTTQDSVTTPVADGSAKQTLFKVGWSYDVFLRKNGLPPSEAAQIEWRTLSQEASRSQVNRMKELNALGCKTTVKARAVYVAKDNSWATSLTARVIDPVCKDTDLILEALVSAQKRASKRLSDMRTAAHAMGVVTG